MTPVEKGLDKVETDIDIRVSQILFEASSSETLEQNLCVMFSFPVSK